MSTDIGLGSLLRRLRTERGEPLRVVAAAAGIDSTLLSRIERGERLPTTPQIQALAAHFDLPDNELETLGDASRLMRTWGSADTVLRAADVIEERTSSSRAGSAARYRAPVFETEEGRQSAPRVMRSSRARMDTLDAMSVSMASDAVPPARRSSRASRLGEIERAASSGSESIDALEAATRDRDSVVALRAAELLRQLRARLG